MKLKIPQEEWSRIYEDKMTKAKSITFEGFTKSGNTRMWNTGYGEPVKYIITEVYIVGDYVELELTEEK